jgi:hypothetical protein
MSESIDTSAALVIEGLTAQGDKFRPSDWAERLCGVMSAFGADHHMQYSPYVQPVNLGGVICVQVDVRLEEIEPMAWRFLLNFARDNELRTHQANSSNVVVQASMRSAPEAKGLRA